MHEAFLKQSTTGETVANPRSLWNSHAFRFVLGWLVGTGLAFYATVGWTDGQISRLFFGLHIHHLVRPYPGTKLLSVWPTVPFGSWRTNGSWVNWYEMEPRPGSWNFEVLDRYVAAAATHSIELTHTLGRPPQWASARPEEPCPVMKGCAAEPKDIRAWEDYLRQLVTRYKGRIRNYEVWNEPAFAEFEQVLMPDGKAAQYYSGTAAKMVELTRVAYHVIKSIDPDARIISPSVTIEGGGIQRLEKFFEAGGGEWIDVVGFHFYVSPPEQIIEVTRQLRSMLSRYGVDKKPIWNTEMGYVFERQELGVRPTAEHRRWMDVLREEAGAAYLARAVLLSAGAGHERVFWLNWDGQPPHRTMGIAADAGKRPTRITTSYRVLQEWLVGGNVTACHSEGGIWICDIRRNGRTAKAVWSPAGERLWTVPPNWGFDRVRSLKDEYPTTLERIGNRVEIGESPLLLFRGPADWSSRGGS